MLESEYTVLSNTKRKATDKSLLTVIKPLQNSRNHLETESEENESPSPRGSSGSVIKYSSPLYSPTSIRRNDNFKSIAAFKMTEGSHSNNQYFIDQYKS